MAKVFPVKTLDQIELNDAFILSQLCNVIILRSFGDSESLKRYILVLKLKTDDVLLEISEHH